MAHRKLGKTAATSLEFALVLSVFLWLFLGTIDVARYLFVVQGLVGLLGEAGRQSLMNPNWAPCGTNPWTSIATISPLLDADNVTLCVSQGLSDNGVNQATVVVQYQFTPYTPGLGGLAGQITETTTYTY